MVKKNDKKIWAAIVTCMAVACGIILYLSSGSKEAELESRFSAFEEEKEEETIEESEESIEESEESIVIMVDVKGAVISPGVYPAADGDRVMDVINKAGNFSPDADPNSVNLAQRVQDQMLIYVAFKGESKEVTPSQSVLAGTPDSAGGEGKVNINTAAEAELTTLNGIGPAKASAILQYREENGPFQSVEDLLNISGIGEKTFEKLKEQVTL